MWSQIRHKPDCLIEVDALTNVFRCIRNDSKNTLAFVTRFFATITSYHNHKLLLNWLGSRQFAVKMLQNARLYAGKMSAVVAPFKSVSKQNKRDYIDDSMPEDLLETTVSALKSNCSILAKIEKETLLKCLVTVKNNYSHIAELFLIKQVTKLMYHVLINEPAVHQIFML